MNNWGANHGAISYGHIGADLITMCSMLRIPVCMHNVPEEKIFRPAAWNAFGMDKEGADFRACKNYGPLVPFLEENRKISFFYDKKGLSLRRHYGMIETEFVDKAKTIQEKIK